jgi:hypothetical protein
VYKVAWKAIGLRDLNPLLSDYKSDALTE